MEVIVIESAAFNQIKAMFETTLKTVTELAEENRRLKEDYWMDTKQASKMTTLSKQWLLDHKAEIGCNQIGSKIVLFRKSNIEAFLDNYKIQRKY